MYFRIFTHSSDGHRSANNLEQFLLLGRKLDRTIHEHVVLFVLFYTSNILLFLPLLSVFFLSKTGVLIVIYVC